MAEVTRNDGAWDVDIIPGETMTLTTAQTYVDGDINVRAVKIIKSKLFDDVWSGPLDKTTAEMKAINSKSSGTQDGSTWSGQYRIYFGKIRVLGIDKSSAATADKTWDTPWHIRMKVTAKMFYRDANGNKIYHNNGKAQYDWNIYGNGTTYTYSDFNNRYDWIPTYYHMINRPVASFMKSVTDSPILWGINFYSTNSTYSNRSYYKREFQIDVLECDGCEIEFLDDWENVRNYHKANSTLHPRSAQTYYYGYCANNGSNTDVDTAGFTDYDALNNGLRESGDDNSTQEFYHYAPLKAGGQGIHGYAIVGQLEDGSYASFTTTNGQSSASVIKAYNDTDEFLYGGHTLYYCSNSNYAAGTTTNISAYWNYYALDVRYLSNYYGTSASASPIYAFGWSGSGTTAAYSRAWIKVEFTQDKKKYKVKSLLLNDRDRTTLGEGYYMLIGASYNSAGEYYRIATLQEPRIYYVDENGKLELYDITRALYEDKGWNDSTEAYSKDIPSDAMPYGTFDNIGGKSVVWNQHCKTQSFTKTLTSEMSSGWFSTFNTFMIDKCIVGHKYYGKTTSNFDGLVVNDLENNHSMTGIFSKDTEMKVSSVGIYATNPVPIGTYTVKYILVDLTTMFGSTIADTLTVADCEAMFPDDYYPYNEGEIVNADVEKVVSKGVNLFPNFSDNTVASENVTWKVKSNHITANGTAIGYSVFTTDKFMLPKGNYRIWFIGNCTNVVYEMTDLGLNGTHITKFVKITNSIDREISLRIKRGNNGEVNLDGYFVLTKNSVGDLNKYIPPIEPIETELAPIISKYFPTGMKSVGTVHDLFDIENGVAAQNVGEVDLGTLNWTYDSLERFYASVPLMQKNTDAESRLKLLCKKYIASNEPIQNIKTNGVMAAFSGNVYIYDFEYTEPDLFKNALHNVSLFYVLAQPTTTPIEPEDLKLLKALEVEGGGTITFEQEGLHLPVPNKETFYTSKYNLNVINDRIKSLEVFKYSKPSGGIPKTDLASAVQTSLSKADTALQSHQDISGKQDKITSSNKLDYSLISNTPTIPAAANNGTLTIQKNGTQVATFGANQSNNVTANITMTHDDLIIASKTFENYTCTANDANNARLFFGKITPISSTWQTPWRVKYKLTITTSEANTQGYYVVDVNVNGSTLVYYNENGFYSTDYRPTYNHIILYPKNGYTNEGAYFGERIQSSRNPDTLARTYKIEVLETRGCTVSFLDTIGLYKDLYNDTKFYYTEMNGTSLGLQESGDANDTGALIYSNGFKGQAGANKIYPYCFFAQIADGSYESFVLSKSTDTAKTKNPNGFLPTGKIYLNSSSNTYSQGALSISAHEQYNSIDYRYSFNITTTSLPGSCYTFIKWTYSNGLLYLADEWLATTLPTTTDGYIYQRIGSNYYTSADYRGSLLLDNTYFYYDNGVKVWEVPCKIATTTNAGLVSTTAQTLGGVKTFNDGINVNRQWNGQKSVLSGFVHDNSEYQITLGNNSDKLSIYGSSIRLGDSTNCTLVMGNDLQYREATSLTKSILRPTVTQKVDLGDSTYPFDETHSRVLRIGDADKTNTYAAITCRWGTDKKQHMLVFRGKDGLSACLGYASSDEDTDTNIATKAYIRGHAGVYTQHWNNSTDKQVVTGKIWDSQNVIVGNATVETAATKTQSTITIDISGHGATSNAQIIPMLTVLSTRVTTWYCSARSPEEVTFVIKHTSAASAGSFVVAYAIFINN